MSVLSCDHRPFCGIIVTCAPPMEAFAFAQDSINGGGGGGGGVTPIPAGACDQSQ